MHDDAELEVIDLQNEYIINIKTLNRLKQQSLQ